MRASRQLGILFLLVLLLGAIGWNLGLGKCRGRYDTGERAPSAESFGRTPGERVVSHTALRALAALARSGASNAQAEEVLQFKPVPADSVAEFERRRGRRAADATGEAASPAAPDLPTPPEPPTTPDTPDLPAPPGKSGNITRLGSDITITADQVVVGDVVALGGDVTVAGHVEGDVAAMGGDVFLKSSARIDGDVVCMGGRLTEEPGASVGGQRVSGLGARGRHLRIEPRSHYRQPDIPGSLVWLLMLLAMAWAFTGLGPGRTLAAVQTLRQEPGVSLGVGALTFALIIPSIVALALVVAILCITIIGIPFALVALLGYVLFLCLMWGWGFVVAAALIGSMVLGRMAARPSSLAMGTSPASMGMPGPAPSLMRCALVGVLFLGGVGVLGRMIQAMGSFGPLHALGSLLSFLARLAGLVALTVGAGAWLRTEIKAGTLARWWRGNQWGRGLHAAPAAAGATAAGTPYSPGPAPGTPMAPEVPPSASPTSYERPAPTEPPAPPDPPTPIG